MDEEDARARAYRRTGELVYFWMRALYARFNKQFVGGLNGNQLFVLIAIGYRGRLTVSELAEHLGVSLSAVTGLTDRLVRLRLVERHRDEGDRRLVFVELTKEGEQTVEDFVQQRKRLVARYFDGTSLEEVERVADAMEKLLAIVQDEDF